MCSLSDSKLCKQCRSLEVPFSPLHGSVWAHATRVLKYWVRMIDGVRWLELRLGFWEILPGIAASELSLNVPTEKSSVVDSSLQILLRFVSGPWIYVDLLTPWHRTGISLRIVSTRSIQPCRKDLKCSTDILLCFKVLYRMFTMKLPDFIVSSGSKD
jgi:hypothetical protein